MPKVDVCFLFDVGVFVYLDVSRRQSRCSGIHFLFAWNPWRTLRGKITFCSKTLASLRLREALPVCQK